MHGLLKYCWLLLLLGSLQVAGQCPSYKYQPEFIVSYGQLTSSDLIGGWKISAPDGKRSTTETATTGANFFTARYFLYSCLSVGFTGGYIDQKGNNNQRYGAQYVTTSTYEHKAVTIAVELNYIYRIRKYVDIYTFIGAGPAFKTAVTTNVASPISVDGQAKTTKSEDLVFHYTPLGVRVGGRIGGFAELGFGYKGLLSGGLSLRLGRRWCSRR